MERKELQDKFWAITSKIEAITSVSDPMKKERDLAVAEMDNRRRELDERIRKAEAGLFDLKMERGKIAKKLGAPGSPIAETGRRPKDH